MQCAYGWRRAAGEVARREKRGGGAARSAGCSVVSCRYEQRVLNAMGGGSTVDNTSIGWMALVGIGCISMAGGSRMVFHLPRGSPSARGRHGQVSCSSDSVPNKALKQLSMRGKTQLQLYHL
jgi:hypothetical protein